MGGYDQCKSVWWWIYNDFKIHFQNENQQIASPLKKIVRKIVFLPGYKLTRTIKELSQGNRPHQALYREKKLYVVFSTSRGIRSLGSKK